jgi:hypothetical protein
VLSFFSARVYYFILSKNFVKCYNELTLYTTKTFPALPYSDFTLEFIEKKQTGECGKELNTQYNSAYHQRKNQRLHVFISELGGILRGITQKNNCLMF